MRRNMLVMLVMVLVSVGGCTGILGLEEASLDAPVVVAGDAGRAPVPGATPGVSTPTPDAGEPPQTCGDTDSASENCGACGHTCLGGACSMGVCQPFPLATGQALPRSVKVRDGVVAWLNVGSSDTLMACTLPCSSPDVVLAGPRSTIIGAPYLGGVLVATPSNPLTFCPLHGCHPASGPAVRLHTLAAAGDQVFWSYSTTSDGGTVAGMMVRDTTGASRAFSPTSTSSIIYALAANKTSVFWKRASAILSCPVAGCSAAGPTSLASNVGFALAVNEKAMVWSTPGALNACDLPDCTNARHVDRNGDDDVSLDDTAAYWADSQTGTIQRWNLAAAHSDIVARAQANPTSVAVDATAIYFTNTSEGAVMRLAK